MPSRSQAGPAYGGPHRLGGGVEAAIGVGRKVHRNEKPIIGHLKVVTYCAAEASQCNELVNARIK